ncbi:MAG TPA: GNAT family N-acetyltransferase [Candidatus Deferrimicrobium sp.]|nr:GNAT family N-acetyltransferase [Candidatus Deferrimicrobium sp.]
MSNLHIKAITAADLPVIARLAEQGFKDFYSFDWQENARALLKASQESRVVVAVAEKEGDVVAYCNLRAWPAGGWIDQIVVDEKHRRKGIGQALIDYIVDKAKEKEFWKISLIVSASDTAATAFYEKYGFEAVGRMKDEIKKGQDGILLSYIVGYELHPNK